MKTPVVNRKCLTFILVTVLIGFGTQSSYGQTITASTPQPLTETILHGSVVTLTLSGATYEGSSSRIRNAVTLSGIAGVSVDTFDVKRVSNTKVTVELTFSGNIDTDTPLTFTVGAGAIANYNGAALTAQIPVTAVEESLEATTASPLTEATLSGSVVTLTLSGRSFARSEYDIERALTVSGIEGVAVDQYDVERISDTKVTVPLTFSGNIDTDAILTIVVGAGVIVGYNEAFTVQLPVTAVAESLEATTASPLTETTLSGSVVTLTLSGRSFTDEWDVRNALTISGIEGVSISRYNVDRVSNTEVTVVLVSSNDFDTDGTLTLTVGADAIAGYNQGFTFEFPVTAVEESLVATTETPLTEATLHGSIVTLTLSGRRFTDERYIRNALMVSGVDGVTIGRFDGVNRVSDTEATVQLAFNDDFDSDATLTLTVGADAIAGYDKDFTFNISVTAMQESLVASTESPLTEATLHGSIVTLTLSGRRFTDERYIRNALIVSGVDGVTLGRFDGVNRVSDTEVTVQLAFSGNFDSDATLTFTIGARAIVGGYNGPALTAEVPVTAMEESLEASTEFPLMELTLHGSVVTLTLSGRRFTDRSWDIENALTISGIDGVAVSNYPGVARVSDTEATVELTFKGDFDANATLTLTIGADAIVGYNKDFTVQVPVTAIEQSDATVSVSPSPVLSPAIGEQLTLSLNITNGENVAGYQAIVLFDGSTLDYVKSANGDYLPADAFFGDPIVVYDWLGETFFGKNIWSGKVILAATISAGAANGNGTLATLTFEVLDYKASTVTLSKFYLVDSDGKRWEAALENAELTEPPETVIEDINRDDVVNIQDLVIVSTRLGQTGQNNADVNADGIVDIVDLVLVAGAIENGAAAPSMYPQALEMLTSADVRQWLSQAQHLQLTNATAQRGVLFLEQLLSVLIPKETALLPNYPNPFNPETWIPYRLAHAADVEITIYNTRGTVVRRLDVGHQSAGFYTARAQAAYWDGRNRHGESVASGLYFYQFRAGDYTALRRMVILK